MASTKTVVSGPGKQTKYLVAGAAIIGALVIGFIVFRSFAATTVPGDMNGDGVITQTDLELLSKNINKKNATEADGDLDGDGDVDVIDLSIAISKSESN